ncbi:sensor histidine kinase [Roseivirga pacifica]|uniref:sensor histidine kinase n=1 Tax=Roseivirga pacifica TaxID=1267423 RepID=UPI0020965278|nr:hypothetical protein [Roseivirga pacifica]MCO6359941.1 hypothetical protein [Roseivirga pacifica]MCO6367311.1 hypothetical protein [Roseivirga pacifica]MCO6370157.1 hypothetical protein [Roseivirga pacifica]MCO6374968.1 hypothetical protein [Roseivirga pacifica]MCO6380226.1 hypothetical protein [Roseivirga pacifica]
MEVLVKYLFSAPLQKPIEFQYLIGVLILIAVGLLVGWLLIKKIKVKHREELDGYKKLIEEKDQELLSFINAQDLEKKQLANAMAENFEKLFSVLNLNLSPLKAAKPVDQEKQQEIFKNSGSVINELEDELKKVCFELMPQTLFKRGLTATLKEFRALLERVHGIACHVAVTDNNQRLASAEELGLFRIAQDWVEVLLATNVPSEIHIGLERTKGRATLYIIAYNSKLEMDDSFRETAVWKRIAVRLNELNAVLNTSTDEEGLTPGSLKMEVCLAAVAS